MTKARAYLAAVLDDWIGRMSGGGGLLLTVFSFFSPSPWQPRAFFWLGLVCVFYASYRAWLVEHNHSLEFAERLAPRLDVVHSPGDKPFFEEQPTAAGGRMRCLRVGLRNLGGTEVPQARLVLDSCTPGVSPAVHPGHELQPMGRPAGTVTLTVPPHATVYFDVAREMVAADQDAGSMHLCYVQTVQNELPYSGDESYVVVLRAEGAGPPFRCAVDLGGRLTHRMDGFRPLGPT